MATKLGIILSFFFFFPSAYFSTSRSEGGQRIGASGWTQPEDLASLVGSGRWSACAIGKWVPPSAHAYSLVLLVEQIHNKGRDYIHHYS